MRNRGFIKLGTDIFLQLGSIWLLVPCLISSNLACSQQNFAVGAKSQNFSLSATYTTKVDMMFVIQDSGSMQPREQMLIDQVPNLVSALTASHLDYQIAVTTMDLSGEGEDGLFVHRDGLSPILNMATANLASVLSGRINVGFTGSPIKQGLGAMMAALTAPDINEDNQGFLRANSLLNVVFLTDSDDNSASANYQSFLDNLRPPLATGARSWLAHVMGVLPNDPNCQTSAWQYNSPATAYIALANTSGGSINSICNGSLQSAVSSLQERILEVVTEYKLSTAPNLSTVVVTINGQVLPQDPNNGWTYNSADQSLVFHGSGIPAPGTGIQVAFTPAGAQ